MDENTQTDFVIQASSRSWSGSKDLCMNYVRGFPAIYWTINKIIDNFTNPNIIIAAPEFDRDGQLNDIAGKFPSNVNIMYGDGDNPLLRILAACERFITNEYFVRIDGLHMFFNPDDIRKNYRIAVENNFDCIKYPDDYPVQLTVDIYKIEALKQASRLIDSDSPYIIHPKYYMFKEDSFKTTFFEDIEPVSDAFLLEARNFAKEIFEPHAEINRDSIRVGDQLTFHYHLAIPHISSNDVLLDVACGCGYGSAELSRYAKEVYGVDIASDVIAKAKERFKGCPDVKFCVQDVTAMDFKDNSFSVVTSFETIEHVDPEGYLKEIQRVLQPEGFLILSTPQNRIGHIPINGEHNREYSLKELTDMVSKCFEVTKITGIKQGCIVHEGEHIGTNTFMVLKNSIS